MFLLFYFYFAPHVIFHTVSLVRHFVRLSPPQIKLIIKIIIIISEVLLLLNMYPTACFSYCSGRADHQGGKSVVEINVIEQNYKQT